MIADHAYKDVRNRMISSTSKYCAIFLVTLMMSGCVTVTDAPQTQFDPTEASEARIALGLNYINQEKYDRARENLDIALRYTPNYYRAQNAMAYYYQTVGEMDAAEKMYQRALIDSPKNGDVHNNFGVFLCSQQRYDEALSSFDLAVKQPYYYLVSASYENAGLCSLKKEDVIQARVYFNKALSHEPYRTKSMLKLSELDIQANLLSEARQRLFKYNKRYGYQPQSLALLIQLETRAGRPTDVVRYENELNTRFPNAQPD